MRFHVGVTFRPKQLLKWIIPLLIALGVLSFADLKLVKADSTFNVSTTNIDDISICNKPLQDYIDYFLYTSSDLYNISVVYNGYNVGFMFLPNYFDYFELYTYSSNTTPNGFLRYLSNAPSGFEMYNQSFAITFPQNKCSNTSFLDDLNAINDYLSLVSSYDINKYYYNFSSHINSTNATGYNSYNSTFPATVLHSSTVSSVTSYFQEIDDLNEQQLVFSSVPVKYVDSPPTWWGGYSSSYHHYPTYWNSVLLQNNALIDFGYIPQREFSPYKSIKDIFIYDSVSNLSNMSFQFTFTPHDSAFTQAYYPITYYVYGQSSHSYDSQSYITFDPIDVSSCRFNYSYTHNSNGSVTLNITSFSCPSGTFTGYSYVSIDLIFEYDNIYTPMPSYYFYDYSLTSDSISTYINIDGSLINNTIYFPLNNGNALSSTRKFYISSYNTYTDLIHAISNSKYTQAMPYYLDTYSLVNPNSVDINWYLDVLTGSVGLGINQGVLFTVDPSMANNFTLFLFLNEGNIISPVGSTDNRFCYNTNDGFKCNTLSVTYDNSPPKDDYDVDYYFRQVSDYIDSITSDMVGFSQVVQAVYDEMPSSLSVCFFVLFILGNVYILLKLIRK